MNRSDFKRGFAATAIGALAVTGLPALTSAANADSINNQAGGADNVKLLSQYTGGASVENDGVNKTVHLVASGGANVTNVRFQYTPATGGAAQVIDTVGRTNGAFSKEWTPPQTVVNTDVKIEAVGLNAGGTEVNTATKTSVTVSANARAVDIANAAGSTVGLFKQPYTEGTNNLLLGAVNGTTSSTTAPELMQVGGPAARPATLGTADASGISPFNGTVDFTGYSFDTAATPTDEAVVGASVTGSDDVEAVKVVKQTVSNVAVTSTPANPVPGASTKVVVKVTDSANRPVAGAQVVAEQATGATAAGIAGAEYTDGNGEVTYTVNAPQPAGAKAYSFYVNTTDNDAFDNGLDFRKATTVTSVAQNVNALTTSSKDGNAFDLDEYDAGDISATLKDQNGNPFANQTVSYSYTFTPFTAPTGTTTTTPPAGGLAQTDADGVATIPFLPATPAANSSGTYTLNVYVENNGTPTQQPDELAAAPLTFKAGDSTLAFDEASTPDNGAATDSTKIAGTTATFGASLKLGDGTALPGRTVQFNYAKSGGGNSFVAAAADQPAGTTRTNDVRAVGTTKADGTVAVAVTDPTTPDQAELGNDLTATTIQTPVATGTPSRDADEDSANLDVDFVDDTPNNPTQVTVAAGTTGTPGKATAGTVTLKENADANPDFEANPGAGKAVTLTVDGNGFFTDGTYVKGAAGDDAALKNLGKSIVVQTDANGKASYQTSIGRDQGFDDDGKVTVNVTGKAGTFTGTDAVVFDSKDPINGGEVSLEITPNQSLPTDPARTGDEIAFDVFTTDQFGNRVGAEDVAVTTDSGTAKVTTTPAKSDFKADGDFTVTDSAAGTVKLTSTWTTSTVVLNAANAGVAGTDEKLTDTATQDFYEVDFAQSRFFLTQTPEGEIRVGSPVTEIATVVDQNNNPVPGLDVAFIRQGPGDQQDGDQNRTTETNANGQALYTFTGTEKGTARVSAVISQKAADGTGRKILTDDVAFVDGAPDKEKIAAQVNGKNNGGKNDRVRIKTTPSAGNARVKLFTRAKNGFSGKKVLLKETRLNRNGRKTFVRPDNNGNSITKYWVVVRGTATTMRDRSNTKKLR